MGKAYNRSVGYRSKKRKFHGRKSDSADTSKSASAKKLKINNTSLSNIKDDSNSDVLQGYRFIDINIFFSELSKFVCCSVCHSKVNFYEGSVRGCSSVFSVKCEQCNDVNTINSCPMLGSRKNIPEINQRVIYSMRCIGQGLSSLQTFCAVMNMPQPVSQKCYDNIVKKIVCATKTVAEASMKAAAVEEEKLTGCSDLCVSGDGTWKTRGHTSKIGVCSVIGTESGKVIDVEVLSSFCKACEIPASNLNHNCKKNHSGSAGIMEVIGMKRIFQRSEFCRKVRYTKYLGDGDTKTFNELLKDKPYDCEIEKLECIGHVQKRMGNRLRKLKQQMRGEKLYDGKPLSGKGRLTDKLIDKLTVYYGNAIRSNCHSLRSMREAVWATYCHMSSTDDEPMHMFCPKGATSWCKFQQHAACVDDEKGIYNHTPSVPLEVMKAIKKIYTDLSAPDLLRRCLSGKTQNSNESLNSVIWKFCPKTSGCGKTVAEAAVFEAVIAFNEGSAGRLNSLKEMGIIPGVYGTTAALKSDLQRVKTAEKRADLQTLQARRAKRRLVHAKNEKLELAEGCCYTPGGF